MVAQLVYLSKPFGFDAAVLGAILVDSRRNNQRDRITGALICRHDIYLQLLEGPREAIKSLYRRIVGDDRHLDIQRLWLVEVEDRLFPEWAMLDDPAPSWLWTPEEVAAGAVVRAPHGAILAIFGRIARERATEPE